MRKFNESLPGSMLTVCLGLVWVASFVPYGYPAAWLVLAMAVALWAGWAWRAGFPPVAAETSRYARWLAGAFVFYAVIFGLAVLLHGGAGREMDKPVRFAVAAVVVLVAVRFRLRGDWLLRMLVAASFAALGYALFDKLVNGQARAGMFVNPIQFGVMAVLVGLLCIMLAIGLPSTRVPHARGPSLRALLWLSAGADMAAAALTGSLTAMLAVVCLPFLVFFAWGRGNMRGSAVVFSMLALVFLVGMTGTRGPLMDRVTSNTSRIENFSSAWHLFQESPLVGVGRDGFLQKREAERDAGRLSAYTAGFNVAHNEYLDTLAKRGLLGFCGLAVLFLVPAVLFATLVRRHSGAQRAWAGAGLAGTAAFGMAALTQNVITHGSGSNMMAATLVVCLCMALQPETKVAP